MSKLDSKVVIVTGATGGIGSASAALFSREGARLVLTGRDEARLHEAAKACDPERTRCIVSDNANIDSLAPVVALAIDSFGGLDGVFANAGTEGKPAPIVQTSMAEFDAVWSANVRGTFALLQLVIPHLIARGGGSVVVTSSTSGLASMPGIAAYSTSKGALLALVRSAALELASSHIRVNALVPGAIDNRMSHSVMAQLVPPEYLDAVMAQAIAGIPMQRFGTNDEAAKAALFLLCDDSSFCTGSALVADGGMLAHS
jgi:NAD(P)-dependent dehydrogenase (short-subunit alcohol dehydrogenase family)